MATAAVNKYQNAYDDPTPWRETSMTMQFHGNWVSTIALIPKQHSIYQTAESTPKTKVHDDKLHGNKSVAPSRADKLH